MQKLHESFLLPQIQHLVRWKYFSNFCQKTKGPKKALPETLVGDASWKKTFKQVDIVTVITWKEKQIEGFPFPTLNTTFLASLLYIVTIYTWDRFAFLLRNKFDFCDCCRRKLKQTFSKTTKMLKNFPRRHFFVPVTVSKILGFELAMLGNEVGTFQNATVILPCCHTSVSRLLSDL